VARRAPPIENQGPAPHLRPVFFVSRSTPGFYADFFGLCVKSCGIVIAVGNKGLKIALL
jgi:hypothetical protein